MKKCSRGFTLIELLVVIAIIGILSSIVFSSLAAARNKSGNAAIRTGMAQMRSQANLYFNNNDNFGANQRGCKIAGAIFYDDPGFRNIVTSVESASGGGNSATCWNTTGPLGTWAVSIKLKVAEGSNDYICTDYTGTLRTGVNTPGSVAVCPASF